MVSNSASVSENISVAVRVRPTRAALDAMGSSGMRLPTQADQSVRIANAPDNKAQVQLRVAPSV